jgi:hypothetical protein
VVTLVNRQAQVFGARGLSRACRSWRLHLQHENKARRQHPPRAFVWALLALVLVAASGCTDDAPPIDIDLAATQTAQAVLGAPNTYTYTGVRFTDLASYRATLTLGFTGTIDGREAHGTFYMDARVDTRPPVATVSLVVDGDAGVFPTLEQLDGSSKTYLGGTDHITSIAASGGETCTSEAVNQFDPLAYNMLLPDLFIPPEEAPPLTFLRIGPHVDDTGPTWHYRAEGFSTATLEDATLEVLVAHDGAHVVQVALRGEGYLEGQEGARGTVTLDYTLSEFDAPVDVTVSPACEPTPTPTPTPEPTTVLPSL